MFSGVRDAIIQNGRVRYTAIRIASHLYRRIHLLRSRGTRDIYVRDQIQSGFITQASGKYPIFPDPSSVGTSGVQQE
jgi:hypothetical protein